MFFFANLVYLFSIEYIYSFSLLLNLFRSSSPLVSIEWRIPSRPCEDKQNGWNARNTLLVIVSCIDSHTRSHSLISSAKSQFCPKCQLLLKCLRITYQYWDQPHTYETGLTISHPGHEYPKNKTTRWGKALKLKLQDEAIRVSTVVRYGVYGQCEVKRSRTQLCLNHSCCIYDDKT